MARATRTPSPRPRRRRRAFTLVEAAWVTMIVGIGAIAMLELLAAGTVSNADGNRMAVAVNLANNVHEVALGLAYADPEAPTQWSTREATVAAYDDVADLDGQTFSPPIDVRRLPIAGYPSWAQRVTVRTVAPGAVTSARPNDITVPTARVTVEVLLNNKVVHAASWLVVGPSPG